MAEYTDLDEALANPQDVTELNLRSTLDENIEGLPVEIRSIN